LFVLVNMQFKALTVLALSSLANASPELEKRQDATTTENPTEVSVLAVLATALPSSLIAIGFTNAPEVGSIIESEFSAGQTPAWYSALPSDVKSYLPILLSEEEAAASTTLSVPSVQASISASISSSLNTTTISSVHSASLKATTTAAGSVTGSASSAGASSTSSGGASYPSAVVGAGVAGALGLLGMLAL
jgi:hypothetical protein